MRREKFGGAAYSQITRRLQVIESGLAFEVAARLDRGETVEGIAAWLARGDSAIQAAAERQVAAALDSLLASGILVQTPLEGRDASTGSSGALC